ncbi:MAG: transcriptional regulator, MarR family [Polyangiaceae bacterium]|jgi:DNA-binding MarR family transcriptional regulator|nr:transcriptional regulator, MarR family [Polyangiaceae bacterium]
MLGASSAKTRPKHEDVARLKRAVQEFTRSFGLLVTKQTPCGLPVSPSYAHCLMLLLERERQALQTSQSEIGEQLTIDKSNIARLCRKLEKAGHASQQRDPDDGRGRLVELTGKGRRMAERLEAASDERFLRVLEAVPTAQRPQLLASLTLLIEAVGALDGAE